MQHSVPLTPQFYVTAAQTCPYLADRLERKLFTALHDEGGQDLNNALSKQGFRRSQNVLYRPCCAECSLCFSARVNVADFKPSRSQKRVLSKVQDLKSEAKSPWASEEQFELFKQYLSSRHADGGMADMDVFEYAAMVEETPIKTRVIEYRSNDPSDHDVSIEKLEAVCLTDVLDDGLSMVYSFFNPERYAQSIGTYLILDHIRMAQEMGLPYVYLGYWVPGSSKMQYKANFSALEIFRGGNWVPLGPAAEFASNHNPLEVVPVAEQVAHIQLPGRVDTP
ncbi:MAG: arginyltransferase [Halocynthiibacter sp.]